MCLSVSKLQADAFLAKHGKRKFIMAYKVLRLNGRKPVGPYYDKYIYQQGWNYSNRPAGRMNFEGFYPEEHANIHKGIHVCTTLADARLTRARIMWGENAKDFRIVRVRCYLADLVAGNLSEEQAVFTKVYLSRDEYRKAVRRA